VQLSHLGSVRDTTGRQGYAYIQEDPELCVYRHYVHIAAQAVSVHKRHCRRVMSSMQGCVLVCVRLQAGCLFPELLSVDLSEVLYRLSHLLAALALCLCSCKATVTF